MNSLPFIRITLLGSQSSGKTCIVNSFVNNYCPTTLPPTPGPSLYYKMSRLPPEDDEKGASTSVVIEIEDTFGSDRTDEGRNISVFYDMIRKHMVTPKGVDDFTPFTLWKPPQIPIESQEAYRPLTQGRMGFMLVFDSNDMGSFEEVQRLHVAIKEYMDNNSKLQTIPVIYFVASKMDKNPEGDEHKAVIDLAEQYAQSEFVRLMKVSSLTGKNIKRTFYDMTRIVIGNSVLWEIEYEERSDSEDEEDEPFCTQS